MHEMVYDGAKGHCELCCAQCPHQAGARKARHGRTTKQMCTVCGVHLCTKARGEWSEGMSCAQMWHSSRPLIESHTPGGAASGTASGAASGAAASAPGTAPVTRSRNSASVESAQESETHRLVSESARKRRKRASVEVIYAGTGVGTLTTAGGLRKLQLDGEE